MFLRALGAPDTLAMRRAVAIWLRFETGGTIVGNNPWNLHGGEACPQSKGYCPGNVGVHKGQIGNRYAGPGDRNVAVFATLQDGVAASAQNLIRLSPSYGYGKVIAEARQGDAVGFLAALQQSSWSAGHYGYRKLVDAFRGSFNYNTTLTMRSVGGSGSGGGDTAPPPQGRTVKLPFRSIVMKFTNITGDDVFTTGLARAWAVVILDTPAYVKLIAGGTDALLEGESWNKARDEADAAAAKYAGKKVSELPEDITIEFSAAASQPSTAQGPLETLANALGGLGQVIGFALDPQNWLYLFALVGGVALAGYGFSQLTGARLPKPDLPIPAIVPDDDEESEAA